MLECEQNGCSFPDLLPGCIAATGQGLSERTLKPDQRGGPGATGVAEMLGAWVSSKADKPFQVLQSMVQS